MSSGEKWQDWIDGKYVDGQIIHAAACPKELPFETLVVLPGGEIFQCWDRGGKIVTMPDTSIWIDLLLRCCPPVPFGHVLDVAVYFPN